MSLKSPEAVILAGILALCLSAAAGAQTKSQGPRPDRPTSQTKKDTNRPARLPLKDLGVVSTAGAAREAAKAKSQIQTTSKTSQSNAGGVLEFQPIKSGSFADDPSKDTRAKDQKKPLLKDFHGSVYGAAAGQGAEGRTAGGDAGASSSSGKLKVFVEGQHSQASNPGSH